MSKENTYFILSVSGEKKKVNYNDIIYFESMGHYIILHLENEEYDYKYNISDLCSDLVGTDFVRTHLLVCGKFAIYWKDYEDWVSIIW